MKIIIGNQWYSTLEGSSVQITRSATDPVPTCSLSLHDNTSALTPQPMQEILVLDDQKYANTTTNMLINPTLNPYTTQWVSGGITGLTISQNPGGGVKGVISNVMVGSGFDILLTNYTASTNLIVPVVGQTYTVSAYVQGSNTPTNINAILTLVWADADLNVVGSLAQSTSATPVPTTLTRMSVTATAPAGTVFASVHLQFGTTNATNSGTIVWTNVQLEPNWFPTMAYPTPFVGPSQTNCQQLPLGYWVRQYRKFAGFITHVVAGEYHGNVRTLQINAAGYAWLAGTVVCNDGFSNQADSAIITTLLNKYLTSNGTAMVTTTYVVTGETVTTLQSNWDDLRTLFDGLCGLTGFYWTIDFYWGMIYAPPGYITSGIGLICDNSSQPNLTTTFPAYDFRAEQDFTQPGSTILVLGSGANVSEVIDPARVSQLGFLSGYYLPVGTSWMRKVNDGTLGSTTDTTNRATAEMLQYDFVRNIYHVKTTVEVIPGQAVQLTSATEGLNASTLLIQQTTASWLGTSELLVDVWEYTSDLGATNRAATNMISRIFRQTQKNTAATAIAQTSLAAFETVGLLDTVATGTVTSNYVQVIQFDSPVAYYRLGELEGTVADDFSGHQYNGTLNGGITLNQASLLLHSPNNDGSMLFNGSTGYISLPTAMIPTGANPWSLEAWVKVASTPSAGFHTVMGWGNTSGTLPYGLLDLYSPGATFQFRLATNGTDLLGPNLSTATTYHAVATYDGTNLRLYQNGSLVAGPTAATLNLTQAFASIGAFNNGASAFAAATIDECGFYTVALSSSQISAHYTAGTT